jgi:hypothetical protein
MYHRATAILAIFCLALGSGGCASLFQPSKPTSSKKKKQYQEVLMPLQTGSTLQRRAYIERGPDTESKKKPKKKQPLSPKPEVEPSETPAPEEESTPPPDRFR